VNTKSFDYLVIAIYTALWVCAYIFIIKPIDITGLGLGLLFISWALGTFTVLYRHI
jgi:hypothetical protein